MPLNSMAFHRPGHRQRWRQIRFGPSVLARSVLTPTQHGFGTTFIEATFSEVSFDYAREGLICEIHVPLAKSEQ
jgi:hypothetical protein